MDDRPPHRAEELEAKYGLPSQVLFCKRCVISNQRPSSTVEFKNRGTRKETIAFDEEGICAACRFADIKETGIDWEKREAELHELCKQYRSKAGNRSAARRKTRISVAT